MSSVKSLVGLLAFIIAVALIYLLFWPAPFDPVAWTPPEAPPLTGVYEPNTRLAAVERLGSGVDFGPEDVAVDDEGRIYGGMEQGRIVRFQPDGSRYEGFADTGGRPLGLHFDSRGNLVVADAHKGLLSISTEGVITVLATEAGGVPFGFTNDVDIGSNGTIYFSDATYKYKDYILDALEHGGNGRLLAYDPERQETRLLLDGLSYANGVAVSPDQSFVLVCETWKYRIRRYWLTGPSKDQSDIFIENLPGFPDGVSSNGKDTFWLALVTPRDAQIDSILPHPLIRKSLFRLGWLRPAPKRYGFVLGLDPSGRVVHNLQDPSGTHYDTVTSVEEHQGMLYLGSIAQDAIGRLAVP